jgi:hypothetical protein
MDVQPALVVAEKLADPAFEVKGDADGVGEDGEFVVVFVLLAHLVLAVDDELEGLPFGAVEHGIIDADGVVGGDIDRALGDYRIIEIPLVSDIALRGGAPVLDHTMPGHHILASYLLPNA